jgi:hypothetical protein
MNIPWTATVGIWRLMAFYYIWEATKNKTLIVSDIKLNFPFVILTGWEILK